MERLFVRTLLKLFAKSLSLCFQLFSVYLGFSRAFAFCFSECCPHERRSSHNSSHHACLPRAFFHVSCALPVLRHARGFATHFSPVFLHLRFFGRPRQFVFRGIVCAASRRGAGRGIARHGVPQPHRG